MDSPESEGLGLSVLIYMTAIFGGVVLIAVPVYLANAPQIYDNPPLARANPLLNGPVIGQRDMTRTPLAVLQHQIIVDPKFVATLNAKLKQPGEPRHAVHQIAQRRPRGTPVAELPDEPRRPRFFLFSLFGG